jgi:hypothetical protein
MSKRYYTLATLTDAGQPHARWCIEFGDYDRDVVEDEAELYREDGHKVRIVSSGDSQEDIEAAVARLKV